MIFSEFPELLLSLTLQCTLVLVVTLVLASRASTSDVADRIWSRGHIYVLLLCLAALLFPHVRLIQTDGMMAMIGEIAHSATFGSIFAILFRAWMVGAAVLVITTLWSLVRTTLLVRSAAKFSMQPGRLELNPGSPETRRNLEALEVKVLWSERGSLPFCWQLHSPVIILPEALSSFPADELDAVLRHELAHLQSQHPLQLFLQRLVEIVFWFHPLVWATSREAALQRELASDRLANQSASQVAVFLKGMVRLTDFCLGRSSELAAGMKFVGSGRSMIQRRVEQLLSLDGSPRHAQQDPRSVSAVLFTAAILASTVWVPLNAQATGRTLFSPWPGLSASVLHELGISVRDYEVDNHRLLEHEHDAQ